jgi:hypothetical protein
MTSEPIYKVFVSSTFEDLREERAEVQRGLLKINCFPVGMELFPAADEETWEFIKQQIDDSDYYVVLVGGRYGSLASDGFSFTEKEYDYARYRDVPSIGFIHYDRGAIPVNKSESDPELNRKLDAFISKIKKRPVRTFANPHQLATEVIASFVDLKLSKPRTGYVRTDQVVEYKKYADALEKISSLEQKLKDVRDQDEKPFPGYDALVRMQYFQRVGNTEFSGETDPIEWRVVFLAVGSTIIESPGEAGLLQNFFTALEVYHSWEIPKDSFLNWSALALIRERFIAENLVDISEEQRVVSGTDIRRNVRLWKLTGYGRRQFALFKFRSTFEPFPAAAALPDSPSSS